MSLPSIFQSHKPLPETISHFVSTPWCARYFQDPTFEPFNHKILFGPSTARRNTFFGKTLATEETILKWQTFRKAPQTESQFAEIISLISLGSGVNGHVDTCHGGFIAVVLDEALGVAAESARPVDKTTMTAYLNVSYKKPVRTPSKILVKSGVVKKEGRKIWVNGSVEDGDGNVLTIAESLMIVVELLKSLVKL